MPNIAGFSKFLAYEAGGAESSTRLLLLDAEKAGSTIAIYSFSGAKFLGRSMPLATVSRTWRLKYYDAMFELGRFSYIEYALNRRRLIRFFSKLNADELWTYGVYGPAALLGFRGRGRYFIRSESDLGILVNYYEGMRYWAKYLKDILEWPAYKLYRKDLESSLRSATVTANSKYMAQRVRECLHISATVEYPIVDITHLRERLDSLPADDKWVVFVGDSNWKGLNLVEQIAESLPSVEFRIFSRFIEKDCQIKNVLWSPWQRESWRIYQAARLVIVPSQCEEAYGKVARESFLLGKKLLVSRVGGLPEAVDFDPQYIVDDFRSRVTWCNAIQQILLKQHCAS
ncbi:MAG TPA: hypothetical protein DIS62_00665 [Candidatus Kerfeldbacteria bacterium]|nr:hypothetical protein [Candidatus Kerfeldbacteria bacterium]